MGASQGEKRVATCNTQALFPDSHFLGATSSGRDSWHSISVHLHLFPRGLFPWAFSPGAFFPRAFSQGPFPRGLGLLMKA